MVFFFLQRLSSRGHGVYTRAVSLSRKKSPNSILIHVEFEGINLKTSEKQRVEKEKSVCPLGFVNNEQLVIM